MCELVCMMKCGVLIKKFHLMNTLVTSRMGSWFLIFCFKVYKWVNIVFGEFKIIPTENHEPILLLRHG
jgi:hypothetical protein